MNKSEWTSLDLRVQEQEDLWPVSHQIDGASDLHEGDLNFHLLIFSTCTFQLPL